MAGYDLTLGDPLEVLEALGAPEPCWMIASQPALRNPVAPLKSISAWCKYEWLRLRSDSSFRPWWGKATTYILDDMAVITNEEERSRVLHIYLHTDES
jgi:hypothetical protein